MKLFEISMAPTKLKNTASTIDALVGLEIEGIFAFPKLHSSKIKTINDIKSYEEFRYYFEEYNSKRGNNIACLTNFVYEELSYDLFNQHGENEQSDEMVDRLVAKEVKNNSLYWWEKYFKSFDTVEEFYNRTYFSPTYGQPTNDKSKVYVTVTYDNNELTSSGKRIEMWNDISQTKFKKYIKEVVSDTSIEFDEFGANYFSAEIVTHPIKYKEVETFVTEFFEYLKKSFDFKTNESTGFHINVSINGQTDIDFCKLMVFLGENHELLKYSREDNTFTTPQLSSLQDEPILEDKIDYFIEEVNKVISKTPKYKSFNINHWNSLHYIEFRIAGGYYANKIPVLLASINRYVTVMDIATDSEKYVKEYHKKVMNLMSKQQSQHPSQLKLKPDTLENAQYNIEQKVGFKMEDDSDIERKFSRIYMVVKQKAISLTSNEKIWLRKQAIKFEKSFLHF